MVRWSIVVPVKRLEFAKTRLRGAVPSGGHEAVVLAMALDTVAAALACPCVDRVLAVTDDPAAALALARCGALVVADTPDAGLNAALEHGEDASRRLAPAAGVAALGADLPALRPGDLAEALHLAGARAFVADAVGTGTTLLAAAPGHPLGPRFGLGSAAAHEASGAKRLTGSWPSLRTDVDTGADLLAVTELGLGPYLSVIRR